LPYFIPPDDRELVDREDSLIQEILPLRFSVLQFAFSICAFTGEILAQSQPSHSLRLSGKDMAIFEDRSGQLTLKDVLESSGSNSFRPSGMETPYYGFTSSAIWVRLDLRRRGEDPLWFLEVEEPLLHDVEFYGPVVSGDLPVKRESGRLVEFDKREIPHRKILFALTLSDTAQTYYVRIRSRDNVTVPLRLWPRREFFLQELSDQIRSGIFYGIILALVLYNLFLLVSLKDINYLYYVLYVVSFGALQTTIDGNFFQILPGAPVWLKWRIPLFTGLSSGVFLLLFTRNFLYLEKSPRIVRHIHWILLAAIGLLFVLSFTDATMVFSSRYANSVSAATTLYAIGCAIYRTYTGFKPARYFTAGWLILLSGVLAASLVNLGFFPPNSLTKHWVQAGFLAELLLFSFFFADRINLLQAQKEDSDRKAMEAQTMAARELERLVKERTRELSVANATKDRFFSIIAHDLRGPIGTLSVLFTDAVGDDGKIDRPLLESIRTTTKNSYHLLEDLLTWARSQRDEIEFRPVAFSLEEALREIAPLFETQAVRKKIRFSIADVRARSILADRYMVSLILRNLISNALKFTPSGGSVRVEIKDLGNYQEISVIDSGEGISAERQESIFRIDSRSASTPGTDQEIGSGLGLILCAEFVRRNGGHIGVESETGKGSRFFFTLPSA